MKSCSQATQQAEHHRAAQRSLAILLEAKSFAKGVLVSGSF
jgi:hypothetical protein